MANLCMGCMNQLPEGKDTCPVCGYPANGTNPAGALPTGTVLQERYTVGRLMGQTGDGLLYLGYNQLLKEPCFVQEFYPNGLCERGEDGGVRPAEAFAGAFTDLSRRFHETMRDLAKVKELPGIIPVYDIFDEHGTVYAISDYCAGMTLSRKVKDAGGRIPWAEARPMFMSLMDCVASLHEAGIAHLAITPDNIIITADGRARLRNFSIPAAHRTGNELKPQLFAGYSAPEQYLPDAVIDDSADVYGMAATIFRTVTGNTPPAGNTRAKDSDDLFMSAEVAEELSQQVCIALFNALQADAGKRTPTMAKLRDALGLEPNVSALVDEAEEDDLTEEAPRKRSHAVIIVFASVLAALLLIAVLFFAVFNNRNKPEPDTSEPLPTGTKITTVTTTRTERLVSVPDYTGKNCRNIKAADIPGGMSINVKYLQYSDQPAGTVVDQTPAPGTGVQAGTVIDLVISCGFEEEKTVIDLAGWKQEHAQAYLEALGFKVEIAKVNVSSYERGYVDSTDPVAGKKRKVGETVVLRVSDVEPTQPPTEPTDPPEEQTEEEIEDEITE